jgi:hypothetical protein
VEPPPVRLPSCLRWQNARGKHASIHTAHATTQTACDISKHSCLRYGTHLSILPSLGHCLYGVLLCASRYRAFQRRWQQLPCSSYSLASLQCIISSPVSNASYTPLAATHPRASCFSSISPVHLILPCQQCILYSPGSNSPLHPRDSTCNLEIFTSLPPFL